MTSYIVDLKMLTAGELRAYAQELMNYWIRAVQKDYLDGAKAVDEDLLRVRSEMNRRGRRYTLGWPDVPHPGPRWDQFGYWKEGLTKTGKDL